MTLRELMIERIMFAVTPGILQEQFDASEEELRSMSDTDFLDLYDELFMFEG